MSQTKKLTKSKIWCFAIGQLGWSMLSALISNYLVNFYVPAESSGLPQDPFFKTGPVIFGLISILALITGFGRVFDAVTDPWIASLSDRSRNPRGRRIPFMKAAAIPFGIFTILTFWSPVSGSSWINAAFLFVMLTGFYLFMTMYCTPFNALIPELGTDQKTRMSISTTISFTFIAGMAVAYTAPMLWGFMEGAGIEHYTAVRIVFSVLSVIGVICLFVPVFTINEKEYVTAQPSQSTAFKSLKATFRNKDFRIFVASDIIYFLGITMFQTAMLYFVEDLLKLDAGMSTLFFVLMTALSVLFYPLVSKLTPKYGKRKLILIAFCIFVVAFVYTACMGLIGIDPTIQGIILCVLAAPAMAIFGILPQAVVADIAECDALDTGEERAGMFYAARTFAMKMGQALALIIVSSIVGLKLKDGFGDRLIAMISGAVCLVGGLIFLKYNEKKIYARIIGNK
ncbi:MAG: MFS transporter [Clostridiales bacterium]|nr:MFS transporter [Clostridiales bacterium]